MAAWRLIPEVQKQLASRRGRERGWLPPRGPPALQGAGGERHQVGGALNTEEGVPRRPPSSIADHLVAPW